jgi:hypothetical protein
MGAEPLLIRRAKTVDHDAIWRILEPVIRAGETYPLPHDMSKAEAIEYWIRPDRETFVAEEDGRLVGTYYPSRQSARWPRACGELRLYNCKRRYGAGSGTRDVRTLAATRSRSRLQGGSVQLRCQHQRTSHTSVEQRWL